MGLQKLGGRAEKKPSRNAAVFSRLDAQKKFLNPNLKIFKEATDARIIS